MASWFQDSYICTINYTNCCRKFIHALPYPLDPFV
ncbi:unnamed protein product [Acanthoscelides obtectus]|uniref:Uncharacterized protein n=1 Tax=Acanthoscelides obtectus TaxID=200917 RepID=A0A9P0K9G8_ACAOB|nr:unnamed protein product [Acanthoscelides obtectus]CAK1677906.1 hypothetical protein AOBTE_LOCUS31637 [Acanthoscelides obtectus]